MGVSSVIPGAIFVRKVVQTTLFNACASSCHHEDALKNYSVRTALTAMAHSCDPGAREGEEFLQNGSFKSARRLSAAPKWPRCIVSTLFISDQRCWHVWQIEQPVCTPKHWRQPPFGLVNHIVVRNATIELASPPSSFCVSSDLLSVFCLWHFAELKDPVIRAPG